jgi:hypothetical protein
MYYYVCDDSSKSRTKTKRERLISLSSEKEREREREKERDENEERESVLVLNASLSLSLLFESSTSTPKKGLSVEKRALYSSKEAKKKKCCVSFVCVCAQKSPLFQVYNNTLYTSTNTE